MILGWVVKYDEVVIDLVRALLVFGADPDKLNSDGVSVRHIIACQTKDPRLLRTLVDVGAVRCPNQTAAAPIKSEIKRKFTCPVDVEKSTLSTRF